MKEKLSLLTELMKLARCDQEIEFLKDIGIRIGLNPMVTNRVLSEMNNYPNKVFPPEKLIEIFKEQYNYKTNNKP